MSVTEPTILIVPGLRDAVAQHWQTLLEARLRAAGRPVASVLPTGRDDLSCTARVEAIERAARSVEETLAANGFAPNAKGRQQGYLRKAA